MQILYPLVFSRKSDLRKILYTLGESSISHDVQISFDTYFNCFYPLDWLRFTSLNNLNIFIQANGKGKLQVFGFKKDPIGYHKDFICETDFINKANLEIPNWKEYQIIYPSVQSVSEISNLNLTYYTNDTPIKKRISLDIVICTYKKEAYILRTLKSLKDLSFENIKFQIIIVDNAKTLPKKLEENFQNLKILYNLNLGGSGGFTKGILNSLENPNSTHILLMDDDIELDERIFRRLESFLLFLKNDKTCISGSMLDAQKPNFIYETSASVNFSQVRFHARNFLTDLSQIQSLLKISELEEMEYGGWWFFLFPKQAIHEVGLPFPFFIRGDDVEYSFRLRKHGYYVHRLNGFGIWHEPFDAKLPQWIYYYTWRNLLIISAAYSKGKNFLRCANLLTYGVYLLSTFQYGILEFILQGVLDFLKGPKHLKSLNPEELHKNLSSKVDFEYIESSFNFYGELKKPSIGFGSKLLGILNLLTLNLFFTKGKGRAEIFVETGRLNSEVLSRLALSLGKSEIIVFIPERARMREFHKNPKRGRKLLWKLLKTVFQLFFVPKKLKKAWEQEFFTLTIREFWEIFLKV